MASVLQDFSGWLGVLVTIGGIVVSAIYIGRNRWAPVLLGAFFAETLALVSSRLAIIAVRHGVTTMANVAAALFLASLIGLAGRVGIVVGVAGLMSETRKRA